MNNWQPIETALKGNDPFSKIILGSYKTRQVGEGFWIGRDLMEAPHWHWDCDGEPTHWMPLPAPPITT